MAAAHIASVISDGAQKIVRLPGELRLHGTVSVREIEETGEVILTPISPSSEPADTWTAFFDDMGSRPRDTEFMRERPMNRPPVDRKLFPEE